MGEAVFPSRAEGIMVASIVCFREVELGNSLRGDGYSEIGCNLVEVRVSSVERHGVDQFGAIC